MPSDTGTAKRITLLTYGSRGDVEPFVALGMGLREAGHAVRLAAPATFAAFAEGRGLAFTPIQGDPDELAQAFADRAGLSWPRMVASMVRHVFPLARSALAAVEQATRDADLVVHTFLMTDAGHTLASLRGIPDVSAQFFPVFMPTAAFSAVALPDLPVGGLYRRGTHLFNTAMFRYGARVLYRLLRAKMPQLPRLAPWPFDGAHGGKTPLLFAYSPHVLPPPVDWPAYAHVTGYWKLPLEPGWAPPGELSRFIECSPPPVYFGPGSIRTAQLHNLLRTVVAAARACGRRTVLGVAPHALPNDLQGADVFAAGGIPHGWLFPQMGFILHHGGAGTAGAAAAAGVPNSATPFSADQEFWARRIRRLGLGPAVPAARQLSRDHPAERDRLAVLLREALDNPVYRQRAADLGAKIRQERGVENAVQLIERLL